MDPAWRRGLGGFDVTESSRVVFGKVTKAVIAQTYLTGVVKFGNVLYILEALRKASLLVRHMDTIVAMA